MHDGRHACINARDVLMRVKNFCDIKQHSIFFPLQFESEKKKKLEPGFPLFVSF